MYELRVKKKPRNIKKIVLSILLFVFIFMNIVFLLAGNYFYDVVMNYNIKKKYTEEKYEDEAVETSFNLNRFNSLEEEYVTLDSQYGYKIKGIFIKNSTPTQNTVVLVHGIGKDKRWSYMKYGDIFLDKGYNIFVYDSRNHGESGGEHPSYGYYEKDDLQTCISYIKSKNPDGIIGVHGESLGASTALMHAESYNENNEVSFYIEDCGYSDLSELYIERAQDYNVPSMLSPMLIDYMSLICKLRSGFFLKDISPVENIDKIKTPIMFIHGDLDDFTPPKMAKDLYNKKTGIKYLYYAKDADHAKALNVNEEKYSEEIDKFLKSVFQK